MARFDDLPADQKAVLQLVLRQGRTYGEIAGLLKISTEAVRDRALTALDAIGPGRPARARRRPPGRARRLPARPAVRLGSRHDARAARRLPARPRLGARRRDRAAHRRRGRRRRAARDPDRPRRGRRGLRRAARPPCRPRRPGALVAPRRHAHHRRRPARGRRRRPRPHRRDRRQRRRSGDKTASTPTQTSTAATTASVEQQINLTPPSGAKKPLGVANVVSQDGQRALAVVGQDLPASGHYVLWVRNGSKSKFLGFFPPVTGSGADKGRLQGLVAAPSDLASYKEMLVTRERSSTPKQPTTIVLKGSLGG